METQHATDSRRKAALTSMVAVAVIPAGYLLVESFFPGLLGYVALAAALAFAGGLARGLATTSGSAVQRLRHWFTLDRIIYLLAVLLLVVLWSIPGPVAPIHWM